MDAITRLDTPLYRFSETDAWRLRDAFEGTLITGSSGSGKSSSSGKNIADSFLRAGMSGLVLTAKAEEADNWIAYAKACGREDDLILFNAESGHCFDPIFYSWNRPGRGAGDLETIIDLFSTLMSIGKKEVGHGHDPFWERGNEQLIRNNIKLLDLAGERVSIANIDRVIKSLPTRVPESMRKKRGRRNPIAPRSSTPYASARTRLRRSNGAISTLPPSTFSKSGRPSTTARAVRWR